MYLSALEGVCKSSYHGVMLVVKVAIDIFVQLYVMHTVLINTTCCFSYC